MYTSLSFVSMIAPTQCVSPRFIWTKIHIASVEPLKSKFSLLLTSLFHSLISLAEAQRLVEVIKVGTKIALADSCDLTSACIATC